MIPVWKESFKITSYQVDFQENIKPTNLMQLFQEAAGNHAAHLGAGYNALLEDKLFWALSRIRVEIGKLPKWGDEIRIETWPNSVVGPFYAKFCTREAVKNLLVCRAFFRSWSKS